jgi:hypothetical protein
VPNYTSIVADFEGELHRLIAERDKVNGQIDRITKAIEAIQLLAQESDAPIMEPPPLPPDKEAGFSDRVRAILDANPLRTLTALEIRDVMLKTNPKDDPKIMLIHIHNTLKRLFMQGELEEHELAEGRKGYKAQKVWLDEIRKLALRPEQIEASTAKSSYRGRRRRAIALGSAPPSGSVADYTEAGKRLAELTRGTMASEKK